MSLFHFSRSLCASIVLTVAATPAARAQLAPSPSPEPLPQIGEVQTSDRSIETLTSAARTTYVITKEQIERFGYRNVGDAIASLPGVEISRYGATGSNVGFGIRGSAGVQVLVLVDGIAAPGSLAGSVNLAEITTSGVQRVEVVEGGGSTLFGTGSIGGIINIITQGRPAAATADVRAGSLGDQAVRLQADGLAFERILAKNSYSLPGAGARTNADYMETSLHAGIDAKAGAFDAALRAGLTDDHVGAPGPAGAFASNTSRETDVNGSANLTLSRARAQSRLTIQAGGSVQRIGFGCDPVNDPNCFQPSVSVSREGMASFNVRNEVASHSSKLLYGIDLMRGVVRSDGGGSVPPGTPNITTNALAQSAVYAQETFFFAAGGRAYAGLRGERDGALGGEFSPSVGVLVPLRGGLSFRGNAATAFRAPNASELYFPGYGNPALRAERANVADLSLSDASLLGGTSVGWFSNRTNDLIIPVLTDPRNFIYTPENVDHALVDGLTFETRTKPVRGLSVSFNVTDLYRALDLDARTRLPHDPVLTSTLGLTYTGGPQTAVDAAGITIRNAGARATVDFAQPLYLQAVPYTSVAAFVRWKFSNHLALSVRGDNLGNELYADVTGFPLPGRTFALELFVR